MLDRSVRSVYHANPWVSAGEDPLDGDRTYRAGRNRGVRSVHSSLSRTNAAGFATLEEQGRCSRIGLVRKGDHRGLHSLGEVRFTPLAYMNPKI